MNNYNELINKPTINGKELIGEVEVSGLPAVTSADVGKVAIVDSNGSWTVGTVSRKTTPSNQLSGRITINVEEDE